MAVPLVPLVYVAAEMWEGSHPKPTLGRSGGQHDALVSRGFLFCFLALFSLFLRTRLLGLEEEVERFRQRRPADTGAAFAPGASE